MVEDAFSPAEVAEIRAALRVACAEVLAALPSVNWTEMHYQPQLVQAPVPVVDGETQRDLVGWKVPAWYRKGFDDEKKDERKAEAAEPEKKAATKAKGTKAAKKVGLVSV